MQIIKYDTDSELRSLEHDIDTFFQQNLSLRPLNSMSGALDMYEENGELITKLELPGFTKDEIKVTTDNGMLKISASHSEAKEEDTNRRYYFHESSRQFSRQVKLPEGVSTEKIDATFDDGVLTIKMPHKALKPVKAIEVK